MVNENDAAKGAPAADSESTGGDAAAMGCCGFQFGDDTASQVPPELKECWRNFMRGGETAARGDEMRTTMARCCGLDVGGASTSEEGKGAE